ncbi:ABC-type bacteriocin/lantibiotic exporter with double-glycine peptidase domain [Lachnospiraceae bacterium PF1-21]|uniref:ABC transporter ATP-binding protein n=1 Tax=Ohessyouella blattaphilus TaxID=2949333 RepID=A0ABT1EP76_9FIRM|nr:ABC transporter ATP-binding protein [Ohessyouella blattaphilus]MCP1111567.1 ABC transporter ATP-binding protein [Ohessyouella blattaphilus]MCR8564961.1 ABC transporter ATP-binding protein [Ohessyouella blattaphilus]
MTGFKYERIKEIFAIPLQSNGTLKIESIETIEFNNLYVMRDKHYVLNGFSYIFKKGYSYCIAGDNGSGKTTLLEAVIGLYSDCQQGTININGFRLDEIDMEYLRLEKISFLEQTPKLLNGSVDDNILVAPTQSYKNLMEKLKMIGDEKTVEYLKLTDKNTEKSGFSGGETQKLALGRALAKNADLYIFDEGNSALDEDGQKFFISCVRKLKKNSIVIIVSHDNKILDSCDRAIYL